MDALEVLKNLFKTNLKGKAEEDTFSVSENTKDQRFVIYLYDRITWIPKNVVAQNINNGTLELIILKTLERLRNPKSIHKCIECGESNEKFTRTEVLHEVNLALRSVVGKYKRVQLGEPKTAAEYADENIRMIRYLKEACHHKEKEQMILDMDILRIAIPQRAAKAIKDSGINTIRELCQLTHEDIRLIPDLGVVNISKLKEELDRLGLRWKAKRSADMNERCPMT